MTDKLHHLRFAIADALLLNEKDVTETDSFLGLGGDSLAAIYVIEELERLGLAIDPPELLKDQSLRSLSERLTPLAATSFL